MQRSYLKYSLIILILAISSGLWLKVHAEPDYEKVRDMLLAGNIEEVIKAIEKDLDNKSLDLGQENSEYYGIALITLGEMDKAQIFLDETIKKYSRDQKIKDIRKHIDLYNKFYINTKLNFNTEEQRHIEINDLLYVYFNKQNIRTPQQEQKIIKEVNKLGSAIPYFPTRLDYLVELKNLSLDEEIENLALNIISKKRKQLFPQTMDFYELASAYKALAVLSIQKNDAAKARDYVKLAQFNIYKMKSIWLNEDLKLYRPILKITQRETDFGYVLPQWLLLLREEYDAYLI